MSSFAGKRLPPAIARLRSRLQERRSWCELRWTFFGDQVWASRKRNFLSRPISSGKSLAGLHNESKRHAKPLASGLSSPPSRAGPCRFYAAGTVGFYHHRLFVGHDDLIRLAGGLCGVATGASTPT